MRRVQVLLLVVVVLLVSLALVGGLASGASSLNAEPAASVAAGP
jgi:hypothetical protein